MAVVGSTLGLPSVQGLISLNMFLIMLGLLTVAGIVWLVVDYARMLILHRKMVCGEILPDEQAS